MPLIAVFIAPKSDIELLPSFPGCVKPPGYGCQGVGDKHCRKHAKPTRRRRYEDAWQIRQKVLGKEYDQVKPAEP